MFISIDRWGTRKRSDASPIVPPPELVVEVLSAGEQRKTLLDKIIEYCSVDVKECWVVSPPLEAVEVLRLTLDGPETVKVSGHGEVVQSIVFEGLSASVADIFAEFV
jgi:Uma2 family endonuclease